MGVKLRRNQFRKLMFIIIIPTYAQISSVKLILKLKLNYIKLKLWICWYNNNKHYLINMHGMNIKIISFLCNKTN